LPTSPTKELSNKDETMLRPSYTVAAVYAPDGMTSPAQVVAADKTNTSSNRIVWLAEAILAAAPDADIDVWTAALEPHLLASGIDTPKRIAALLGQAAVEAGRAFTELAEDTCYTHAERLCAVFPHRFPSEAVAQPYVYNAQKIACRAYAGKNGNGDEASEDGWRFRGSGLLQLTGRANFQAFAAILPATADQVAEWIRTPNGAAASACWYWRTHNLNTRADQWNLGEVTRRVTGMPGSSINRHADRVLYAEAARKAAEAACGKS
jgi:putative chitinase